MKAQASRYNHENRAPISGGLLAWVEYWTLFTILSGTMLLSLVIGVSCYLASKRSLNARSQPTTTCKLPNLTNNNEDLKDPSTDQ